MGGEIQQNVSLASYSTFRIGGPARYFCTIHSTEELMQALLFRKKESLPIVMIGNGSNCLFHDRGFDGLVIHNKITHFKNEGEGRFIVGSGFSFSLLGKRTAQLGFSGLEFASGIPGTVGGAICMNAGANGRETESALEEVEWFDLAGVAHRAKRQELQFSYRSSSFQGEPLLITEAVFDLSTDASASKKQKEILSYRTKTQPYGQPSVGCIFRNPRKDLPAGALIEETGLKGVALGDAMISEQHANFIINRGNATQHDVEQLIDLVRRRVQEKHAVELQVEVRSLPYMQ